MDRRCFASLPDFDRTNKRRIEREKREKGRTKSPRISFDPFPLGTEKDGENHLGSSRLSFSLGTIRLRFVADSFLRFPFKKEQQQQRQQQKEEKRSQTRTPNDRCSNDANVVASALDIVNKKENTFDVNDSAGFEDRPIVPYDNRNPVSSSRFFSSFLLRPSHPCRYHFYSVFASRFILLPCLKDARETQTPPLDHFQTHTRDTWR